MCVEFFSFFVDLMDMNLLVRIEYVNVNKMLLV